MLEPIPAEINATTQRRAAHSVDEFPGLLLRLLIMVPSPVTQYRRDRWRSASLATSSRAKCALEATSRENRPGILEAGRDGASLDRSPSSIAREHERSMTSRSEIFGRTVAQAHQPRISCAKPSIEKRLRGSAEQARLAPVRRS